MFILLNVLALAATAAVAYVSAIQGVYRAALTLAACVLAGAAAFGLVGPLAGLLPSDDPQNVWYFAADALCLWAVFSVAFLALRTVGEKFFGAETDFPHWADRIGGVVVGAATGYLTVGVCLVLVQMLPMAPDFLGYEAFKYVAGRSDRTESVEPTDAPLWLRWDRGTLKFFGYLSAWPLGSEERSLFRRYGDVYPPPEKRGRGYQAVLDADDVLYDHWYRRWEFVLWRTGAARGPIPEPARNAARNEGLVLGSGEWVNIEGINLRIARVERRVDLEDFSQERLGSDEEFLLVTVWFRPLARGPAQIDSNRFYLKDSLGARVGGPPLLYGEARAGEGGGPPAATGIAAGTTFRKLRTNVASGRAQGRYLADGAVFNFTEYGQMVSCTLVFVVPKSQVMENIRLYVEAASAEAGGSKSGGSAPPAGGRDQAK
jgi:uncharacterized membrane protein required for colicin V production